MSASKVWASAAEAVRDVPHGATLMFGGFSTPGIPRTLIAALAEQGARDLTIIANSAGGMGDTPDLGLLVARGQVRKAILSFPVARTPNSAFERAYVAGDVELELVPQGTLAERIRAGGAGIPAFYTPTAADTVLGEGKPRAVFDGRECVLETALFADYSFVHAETADEMGNLVFHGTARNFNPIVATAARISVVEANHIVPAGAIGPEEVVTPGVFVHRIVPAELPAPIRHSTVKPAGERTQALRDGRPVLSREGIAARIARELRDGEVVNLGTGLPSMIVNHVPPGVRLVFHAENGVIGYGRWALPGEEDAELISAGYNAIVLNPGASLFHSADSFGMVRGGHIDVAVLGGYQVSGRGDLANWVVPGQKVPGVGGAMDLVKGARRRIVGMEHTTRDGGARLVHECSYPLTGARCVNTVVTDLGVFDVTPEGLRLREIVAGWTVDEVQAFTEPRLLVDGDLPIIAPE